MTNTAENDARREARMFLAADVRDQLAESTDLGYGDRNRIAWDTVDSVLPPGSDRP